MTKKNDHNKNVSSCVRMTAVSMKNQIIKQSIKANHILRQVQRFEKKAVKKSFFNKNKQYSGCPNCDCCQKKRF